MSEAVIMIVNARRLPAAPKAFRDYVEQYFVKDSIWDLPIYRASTLLHWTADDEAMALGGRRGLAPRHHVDLSRFDGLADWLMDEEGGEFFRNLYASGPHKCGGDCD